VQNKTVFCHPKYGRAFELSAAGAGVSRCAAALDAQLCAEAARIDETAP
jgi:hypothetical protein